VSLVGEHAQDIKSVAERLQEAVDAAWPTRGHNQYSRVYVLMLYWEEDDLGVAEEVWALQNIFMTSYYYSVRVFEIPSAKPTTRLQTRIAEFLKHDGPNTLLIVYYAGHAIQDQQRGQPPIWIS
jgi:hypothetical protein